MTTDTAAMESIRDAASRFVRTCGTATDAQWARRPDAGGWSIGDVVEHVTIANANLLRRLQSLDRHPLDGRQPAIDDVEIPYLFYRGDEPPNVATPTGSMAADRTTFPAFEDGVASIANWFAANTLDLRAVGVAHPVFGVLDGVQWLLFSAAHTERHRAQIIGMLR